MNSDVFSGESGDVIVELLLSRDKLATGGKFPIAFTRRVPCEKCKGLGRKEGAPGCDACGGEGRIERKLEDAPVPFTVDCEKCSGRGHAAEDACATCERGYTKSSVTMDVEVPPLSTGGVHIRIPEQGHIRSGKAQGTVIVVLGADSSEPEAAASATKSRGMAVFALLTIAMFLIALYLSR